MYFSGVSAVILVLMILGTGYDYYLSRKFHRNTVIYDLEKHGKLDQLANGNQKALNGKRTHHAPAFESSLITCCSLVITLRRYTDISSQCRGFHFSNK